MASVEAVERRLVDAASGGDDDAFRLLFDAHRREIHVHCYRMLGSIHDAEDLVQETFLQAWRRLETFRGRASFRAWLYRISTNACLAALERRRRRLLPADVAAPADPAAAVAPPLGEIPWLEPYPDVLLDELDEPGRRAASRETIEVAFLAAMQHLPPRQRAALLLRDVLGWSASEIADVLAASVPAVNSALQRARGTMRNRLPRSVLEWPVARPSSAEEKALLDRYVAAWEAADVGALVELLAAEATLSMPPTPSWYRGRAAVEGFLTEHTFGPRSVGAMRLVPTAANRQPAVAVYLRAHGDSAYRALAVKTLAVRGARIADIVGFADPRLFSWFRLPEVLSTG